MSTETPSMTRRVILASAAMGLPAVGILGFAAQTGRIDVLTPVLPADGDLPAVPGVTFAGAPVPGLTREAFSEGVTLLNVWASWCPYCRAEHERLMYLSERPGLRLFGLLADDTEDNARAYLAEAGNPYRRLSADHRRTYLRALKQRGVPSTFVFRADGSFVYKIAGELTGDNIAAWLDPAIERAKRPAV